MTTKEEAYKVVANLVERFEEQYTSYKRADYNETLTRRDFIDPFFKALGWDIDNHNGYAEAYREVIHEDKVKVGKATKAPDYSFRLVGGKRLFFVEAKKPSVVVKDEIQPAYQVRRYGWSAKLPVSIITDFEEFAIYDCTKKPNPTDKASVARIKYLTFRDYLNEFEFLWDTFSKERVLKGSFDKFVQGNLNKKGTATVDKEFLQSLDKWRTDLAHTISKDNKQLDEDEINFAVQQTIDRLIFLRIAEDRGVEQYGNLQLCVIASVAKQSDNLFYQNLFHQFEQADDKYNSGLFDFKKDKISKSLSIDNKVLKSIITELYYPASPYEFSVLSVEILGSAYEQFLGKQIKIDKAHRAHIEEKPEVRKAGGVYYTPQYVVEYIVKNTVGKLLDEIQRKVAVKALSFGEGLGEAAKIKILDPACGSGSFLIGAYQYLLDWHKNYYTDNGKSGGSSPLLRRGVRGEALTPEGNLTTSEKKRILLNNIFGVDIDVNAVEVTKLSLLLKCMEGETNASIKNQFSMFNERVLPSLENNIKSGNSLIDTDFYANQFDFEPEQEKKIKPFNWQKAFPEVFNITTETKATIVKPEFGIYETKTLNTKVEEPIVVYSTREGGGFDCVIGNPPYVMAELDTTQKNYLVAKFKLQEGKPDLYRYFIEKSFNVLKDGGVLSFIIPNSVLTIPSCKSLRKYLLKEGGLIEIVNFWGQVFYKVSINNIILTAQKGKTTSSINFIDVKSDSPSQQSLIESQISSANISKAGILENENYEIRLLKEKNSDSLISKILKHKTDKLICKYTLGMQVYHNSIHSKSEIQERIYHSTKQKNKSYYPESGGSNIKRYFFKNEFKEYVSYGEWCYNKPDWDYCNDERILIREIPDNDLLRCCLSTTVHIPNKSVIILKAIDLSNKYLLGILNSKLIGFYVFNSTEKGKQRLFPRISLKTIKHLPLKNISLKNGSEVILYKDIIALVEQIMKLNQEKSETKLETKITQLQSKIEYCEDEINKKVYKLYDLTPEEIEIVNAK